jgi:hypothetical protein
MQDILVDNNFRITEKFEKLNLDSQIYFYEFFKLNRDFTKSVNRIC